MFQENEIGRFNATDQDWTVYSVEIFVRSFAAGVASARAAPRRYRTVVEGRPFPVEKIEPGLFVIRPIGVQLRSDSPLAR